MGTWDTYIARMEIAGKTERDRALKNTQRWISHKLPGSLSYHTVMVGDTEQQIAIINDKESLSIKDICSLPGETLPHGEIIDFADSKWLVTTIDTNDEVYTRGTMEQCNYLLKWLNHEGKIIERWCIVADGTKYLIGEKTEDMMAIGDARLAVTIGKDHDTDQLSRGKRFLIDDLDSDDVLAYQITKPNKLYNIYKGKGVFRFILNEVNVTDDDNVTLRIADYYNWKPPRKSDHQHQDKDTTIEEIIEELSGVPPKLDDNKEVWL